MTSAWVRFRNEAEAIIGIGAKFAFPILATVAPAFGLPTWVGTLAGSLVPQLMSLVEANTPTPGSGAMKKQQVINLTTGFMELLQKENLLTGAAAQNLDKFMPTVAALIDQTVTAVNALAPQIIANDAPDKPADPTLQGA